MNLQGSVMENYGLQQFALLGDDEGVRRAIKEGADVNALDSAGRSAIMCAVSGECWENVDALNASFMTPTRLNALKILLNHPETSLLTMNRPDSSRNGVVPLGMAAWLNLPEAVCVLLEESLGSVSVDGLDCHGATALMYAARDGSLEVVRLLLSHGARPDFRDHHHRTSVQYALEHPQVLWLCETVLRRHRWRQNKQSADRTRLDPFNRERLLQLMSFSLPPSADLLPPPLSVFTPEATSKSTNILVQSIYASNLSFIHSLLFSPAIYPSSSPALYPIEVPILVNLPDSKGWSLIHHCVAVERPSIEILDALYCAGADVSLVTTHEEQTALHIIARLAKLNPNFSSDLQQFVLHLVNDLRAPLAAQDKDDETCIHFAAEHGDSLELLQLLLACDINGTVREMKNSRGLTPVEVSKPEFLSAFGVEDERSPSALSHYTIRPRSHSTVSLASIYVSGPSSPTSHEQFVLPSNVTTSMLIGSSTGFDPTETTHKLIANLDTTSPSLSHSISREHIDYLEKCVDQTQDHCDALVIHFRSQIEDAARAVRSLRKDLDKIRSLRNAFSLATRTKLAVRGLEAIPSTRRVVGSDLECQQRGSEDSQVTVSSSSSDGDSRGSSSTMNSSPASASGFSTKVPPQPTDHVSAGMQTSDQYVAGGFVAPNTDSTWMDRFIRSPESGVCWTNREEVEPELTILRQQQRPLSPIGNGSLHTTTTTRGSMRLKQVMKKMKKLEEKIQELEAVHYGSTTTTTSTTGNRKKNRDSSLGTRSRVKAWLKKMVVTSQGGSAASSKSSPGLSSNSKLEIVLDVDEADEGAVGREIKQTGTNTGSTVVAKLSLPTTTATAGPVFQEYDILDRCVDNALRTSEMVLEHACGDMKRILQCLDAADKFLESANSSIMKTQRIVKRAVKQRELMLIDLHAAAAEAEAASKGKSSQQDPPLSPGLLGYSTALTSRPSLASISTIYSTASSTSAISLAATLTAPERHRQPQDEQVGADSRTIRRLLLRRIEAQISGAWGEVDKVSGSGWVQVVKESVRGVKRRAYL